MTVLEVVVYVGYLAPDDVPLPAPVVAGRRIAVAGRRPVTSDLAVADSAREHRTRRSDPLPPRADQMHRAGASAASSPRSSVLAACSIDAADVTVAVTGTDDACTVVDEPACGRQDRLRVHQPRKRRERALRPACRRRRDRRGGERHFRHHPIAHGGSGGRRVLRPLQARAGRRRDQSSFTVTGEGGTAQATPDRTVAFEAVEFRYPDLDSRGSPPARRSGSR